MTRAERIEAAIELLRDEHAGIELRLQALDPRALVCGPDVDDLLALARVQTYLFRAWSEDLRVALAAAAAAEVRS